MTILFLIVNLFPSISIHLPWLIICAVTFLILAVFVFYAGKLLARSPNKQLFIGLVMFNIIIKMLASVILIAVYVHSYKPENSGFIIPFIGIYIIVTIFETYFLEKQARQ